MKADVIPFNRVYLTGHELENLSAAVAGGHLAGDGPFSKQCQRWLEEQTGAPRALLTHSATAALEMAALLIDLQPGDEVILPSFTFVSTANAFVLRGAVPVFVDIRPDTLNIDERLIEQAITPKTKAIVVVHYAGVACEMQALQAIAEKHDLWLIEDAAQGLLSTYGGRSLGAIGDLGVFSFHETKNIGAGEGGALLINDPSLAQRAEILREKGTNRSAFLRGQVDKYTWVDIGSSFLPNELTAAFLLAQLQAAREITGMRMAAWESYASAFGAPGYGFLQLPTIPGGTMHNAHIFYLLLPTEEMRDIVLSELRGRGVMATSHYVPLHSSPMGKLGVCRGSLDVTQSSAARLLRLPLWAGMPAETTRRVVAETQAALQKSMLH